MSFLRRLFGGGGQSPKADALHLYIQCKHCGTPVHVRVNLANDLAADYGDTEAEGYVLSKDAMDDRCFRIIRVEIHFDARRNEISRTIEGGAFISEAEWEALRQLPASERRPPANSPEAK